MPTESVPASPGRRNRWRFAVPVVCAAAGVLLAATYSAADGREIRRGDAPRLVDLVRESRAAVDRLDDDRDALAGEIAAIRTAAVGGAGIDRLRNESDRLAELAGLTPVRGPGLVISLTDAPRDTDGRYPSDASPDDLVVHQQDLEAVLNAVWAGGAEAVAVQDQRIVVDSVPLCVGNTLLLGGRTYSPPYVISAVGDAEAMSAALAAAPLVTLYRQYVVRFGLGYTEQTRDELEIPGYGGVLTTRHANRPR